MDNIYKQAEKISEGSFRECFAVEGDPCLCIKRLRPDLGFFKRLQVWVLRRRINEEEQKIYDNLPKELKSYFNPIVAASRKKLVTVRPLDYDGQYSRPVSDYRAIPHEGFWQQVEEIVQLLDEHRMWFFDIFLLGTNIFVQRLSANEWKPVIVDYKHIGWKSFPMQVNLLFATEKRKKFYRSYRRFEARFRKKKTGSA